MISQTDITHTLLHAAARKAMKDCPEIIFELTNLTRTKVIRGRHLKDLSEAQRRKIIPSQMNITSKVDPTSDGTGRTPTTKAKARFVAGGHCQDRNPYTRSDTTSPACSITGLFAHAAMVSLENEEVVVTDVTCAYLNAAMPKSNPDKLVFVRIDAFITSMLITVDPSMKKFVTISGTLIVELDKALYGCIESARLWFNEITSTLKNMGFIATHVS